MPFFFAVCITFLFLAAPFHLKRWQRPWLLGFSLYSLSFIPFAYNAVGVIEDVHGFWTKKILRPKTSTPFVHVFKVSIALIADSQFLMILNRYFDYVFFQKPFLRLWKTLLNFATVKIDKTIYVIRTVSKFKKVF